MPVVGMLLLAPLERARPVDLGQLPGDVGAIVVLGAGIESASPEYGRGSLDALSLERVRYGAFLARATGLPLLTTGADPRRGAAPVGEEMARVLREEFQVPVQWVDVEARNTWQNAGRAAAILGREGIGRVLVVTHAWHMPRTLYAFGEQGLAALPAPTAFTSGFGGELGDFVPSAKGLSRSSFALHEWLGNLAYRLGVH